MAKITTEHVEEFPTLPDDSIIAVKVEDIALRDVPGRDGREGWTKMEVKFSITSIQVTGDGSPVEDYANLIGENIWGSTAFRLTDTAENKLRIWCEALLDMEIGVGFELDTDYLLRREARAITGSYERSKAPINPGTGKKPRRHQVETLLRKGGFAAPAPAAPQDPWAAAPPAPQPVGAGQQTFEDPPF